MTEQEFLALAAQGYNRIPLTVETFADLDTPLSIYLKLANEPYTYLLESVQGGERFGRYSIIGLRAHTRIEVRDRTVLLLSGDRIVERRDYGDPLAYVGEFMQRIKVPPKFSLPRYCGGLVGCFGYDTVRYIEPKLAKHEAKDEMGMPDIALLLSEEIAIVDNLSGKLTLVVYAEPEVPGAYKRAQRRLAELVAKLREPVEIPADTCATPQPAVSSFGQEAFKAAVQRAKDYIIEGDIMQVVLSQRMSKPFAASPMALYRSLRALNPSPYMFYFNFEDFHVVGSSPEILVKLENEGEQQLVTVRPIAGTRKRGATHEEDLALEKDLLADRKELAEHLQLLDLGRNDVGRVAATGTVKVTEQFTIERYSHVMHIVSNVEGLLPEGQDKRAAALAVLRATFPAGTVSGAPKVRAMQIIDELEPVKRGIYAGACGYIGFDGDVDVAIAIRTAVIANGQLHVQAGAGIVADSDPESEWQETLNKARAVIRAAEIAESGLDTKISS
ncbi:anthranilate synthase component I [Uliginosibacterium sp. 31-12]|uniref:anthranilate synthase component I n=1 Tax=Uliginosibacterium sp. 31-12 TaxID=3062781 RepID=UPI0026E3711A|nr:anthranilate synthase component I [Uliginosibacterium sp. 31-12]MDO6387892.1 anthranilate synthase component I [Uliginosibacterium sp. 31-12]